MPTNSPASPKMSNRLSAVLDLLLPVLLDVSTALGSLKEGQRQSEQRLDRHGHRLASAEANIASLRQKISTSKPCLPTPPSRAPATMTRTTPPSTATPTPAPSSAITATDTATTLSRTLKRFGRAALKDFLLLIVQRLGGLALQYALPIALALLPWLKIISDWLRMAWHAITG